MEYYLSVGSEKRGPYSVAELAARGIGAESLVMAADGGSWQPAWQVEALRPILRQQTAAQQSQPIMDSGVNISSGPGVSSPSGPGVSNASGGEQVIVGERIGEGPDVVQGYAPQPSAQPESERTVPPSVDRDPVSIGVVACGWCWRCCSCWQDCWWPLVRNPSSTPRPSRVWWRKRWARPCRSTP